MSAFHLSQQYLPDPHKPITLQGQLQLSYMLDTPTSELQLNLHAKDKNYLRTLLCSYIEANYIFF